MTDAPEDTAGGQGELGLSDAELWDDPFRTRDAIEDRLFQSGAERLVLDGPRTVPLTGRTTCPVVVLRFTTLAKMNELPFDHAVITAMDLRGNRLLAAPALEPIDNVVHDPPSGEPPTPALAGEAFHLDLRQRLGLAWEPGAYLVTVLLRDEVSARIRIDLRAVGTYEDPEVVRYLEERRRLRRARAIFPLPVRVAAAALESTSSPAPPLALTSPSYFPTAGCPAVPDSVGIHLSAPRVVPLSERDARVLQGSFRLPVQEADLVVRSGGQVFAPAGAEMFDVQPAAVVPITLLFTGSASFVPVVVRLCVPSFSEIDRSSETPVVTGTFAVPFHFFSGLPYLAETTFLYAFSGETMVGPVPVTTVADPG